VGLLPDLSPYTPEEAVKLTRRAAVIAALSMSDIYKLESERKTIMDSVNRDASPEYVREMVQFYNDAEKDEWHLVITEATNCSELQDFKVQYSFSFPCKHC